MGIEHERTITMSKVKIVTDSASDISREDEEKYGIHIMCFPITVGDRSFKDRDVSYDEYYEILENSETLPVHSQITIFEFEEVYRRYAEEGYTDLIFVSINSFGSSTYSNSLRAKEMFASEYPELATRINIRCVDSLSYSGTYGFPVIEAAKAALDGASADDIEAKLISRFDSAQVFLACYNLRFAKKSGRISAMTAFAGELLGFRPVILLSGKGTKTVKKVRGDQNIIPALVEVAADRIRNGRDYLVIGGKDLSKREELAQALTKKLGYPPVPYDFRVGGAVAANAGPDVVAFAAFDTDTKADR